MFENCQLENLKDMQSAFCIEDYNHMENFE
jgi:hypothetical protein